MYKHVVVVIDSCIMNQHIQCICEGRYVYTLGKIFQNQRQLHLHDIVYIIIIIIYRERIKHLFRP